MVEAIKKNIELCTFNNVVVVRKMGNIVSRVGIEPTSLGFQTSVLTITPPRLSVTTLLIHTCLCGSLPERLGQTTTLIPLEL